MQQIIMAAALSCAAWVYRLYAPQAWVPILLAFIGGIWLLYAIIRHATRRDASV